MEDKGAGVCGEAVGMSGGCWAGPYGKPARVEVKVPG